VDGVDNSQTTIDVGWSWMSQAGCGTYFHSWNQPSLWRDAGVLIHKLSTGKAFFLSNPHLGDSHNLYPYVGAQI
jgi:hypothetical protein